MATSTNDQPAGSAATERVSAADMPSPLLLKRLQKQKKKLTEAKARRNSLTVLERTQQWPGEQQTPNTPEGATLKLTQSSSSKPGSSGNPNRRSRDFDRRIEGMGIREMDQFVSTLKKENFDLKLNLFHLRQRETKTDKELSDLQTQLAYANAKIEELTQINQRTQKASEQRQIQLDEAMEVITLLQDACNHHDGGVSGQSGKHPGINGQETAAADDGDGGDVTSPNSDSTLKSRGLISVGISPFSYQDSSTSLDTPFRAQLYQSSNALGSPCPSAKSNLIDLNTPCSVAQSDTSFLRANILARDKGAMSIRLSLAPHEFVNRCTSAMSESLPGGEDPPSPTRSMASALDSPQLSMLSESSFASMYRSQNHESEESEESEGDSDPPASSPARASNKWGRERGQTISGEFTPSRRASPTQRLSPRIRMREYMSKEDRERGWITRNPEMGRSTMPPTPESISPIDDGGYNCNEDSDIDDDANCCMSMVSPTEMDNQTKATSVDEDVYRPTVNPRNILETLPLNKIPEEIAGSVLNSQRSFKRQSGNPTIEPRKEQAFGDITNMRDTHKRLGYGSGDRLGNRNHIGNLRKYSGRDLTYSARKHVNMNRKEGNITIPVRPARGLPVRTPLTAPQADHNLTPPDTPNSDSTPALTHKTSWESFNSGSYSISDRAASQRQITPHAIGNISASALKHRNNVVTETTAKLGVTLNRGLDGRLVNMRRRSGIPTPEVRGQSGVPALARSSSQWVGARGSLRLQS